MIVVAIVGGLMLGGSVAGARYPVIHPLEQRAFRVVNGLPNWLILAVRQRPGTSEHGAILRGADVPAAGPSFPSGHVILVAAVACVVLSRIPDYVVWVPFTFTTLVTIGRVYVGAHNPLDVTAGLGAGLLLGGVLGQWVV